MSPFPGLPGSAVTNAELLDWGLANHRAVIRSNQDKAALREWLSGASSGGL